MVQLTPKVVPELEGCKSFGFHNQSNFHNEFDIVWQQAEEHRIQYRVIATLFVVLHQFQTLPCEVSMTVGSKDGCSILEGTVEPYDQSSANAAGLLIEEITLKVGRFAQTFPKSNLTVKYSQTVSITRVDR